ncbi:hypothetical protein P5V15_013785 [Pogonomyrmex californicus]
MYYNIAREKIDESEINENVLYHFAIFVIIFELLNIKVAQIKAHGKKMFTRLTRRTAQRDDNGHPALDDGRNARGKGKDSSRRSRFLFVLFVLRVRRASVFSPRALICAL